MSRGYRNLLEVPLALLANWAELGLERLVSAVVCVGELKMTDRTVSGLKTLSYKTHYSTAKSSKFSV